MPDTPPQLVTTRTVRWLPAEGTGAELLNWSLDEQGGSRARGAVVGERGGTPYGLLYEVRADARWFTREVRIEAADGGLKLHLLADGLGHWVNGLTGQAMPELDGCLDVDLAATPYTNTLPIRRCGWAAGQVRAFAMAYIALPDLAVTVDRQRYTCLVPQQRFLYESEDRSFAAELAIDDLGLVLDYPQLFTRVRDRQG